MKELGEYFREVRESNGVSLEEASSDLDIDSFLLESIEEGNVRAFKDVLGIKEKVRSYAKYLGINPDEVTDEFNDFLFEHTSKISLSDILEAQNAKDKKDGKKVSSPYTIIKPKKVNYRAIRVIGLIICISIVLIIFIIYSLTPKREKIINELMIEGDFFEKTQFTE